LKERFGYQKKQKNKRNKKEKEKEEKININNVFNLIFAQKHLQLDKNLRKPRLVQKILFFMQLN
jgi:hypothetical protein